MTKKASAFVLTLLLIVLLSAQGFAEKIYYIHKTLSVNEALRIKKGYGIAGDGTSGKIILRMFVNEFYGSGSESERKESLLYGAFTESNTNDYRAQSWDIVYDNGACYYFIVGNFACLLTGGPTYTKKSTDYKGRLIQSVDEMKKRSEQGGNKVLPIKHFDVLIELELLGSTTLSDVGKIHLPGIDDLYAYDFYKNPCDVNPSIPGCHARAYFKSVQSTEGKKPIVIAHRGFHGDRATPENSLAAVQRAYESKYRYVEVDIRMTDDNVPFLFHDEFYGYATNYLGTDGVPYLNNQDPDTHTENRNWAEVRDLKYRSRYWDQNYDHATNNNGNITPARLGVATSYSLNSFDALCQYIAGKDIFVYLDIKSAPTERNFEVMLECIKIATTYNVLHQTAFKMVRTNAGAPPANQLVMPVQAAKAYLGEFYDRLKQSLNIHIVDYDPSVDPSFVKDWITEDNAVHNVIGFEFDIAADPIFDASALTRGIADFGLLSAWEYTKSHGFRTGVWSSTALDPRGRPGHDPSSWSTGSVMKQQVSPTWQRYQDNRARLEFLSLTSPQYITHDRPDEVKRYLQAVSKLNPHTFRP